MRIIEEKIVDAIWQEVAMYNDMQASQGMARLGDRQTDLVAFVMTSTEELSSDASELGIYIFFVVYRIFEKSSQTKLKRISANKIMLAYKLNQDNLLKLEGAHDRFFERVGEIETAKQPHVMRYVLDAIIEADKGPDPVLLSDQDTGALFLVLKTVIDVLDKALSKSSRVTHA